MPNHVTNIVSFDGNQKNIAELLENVKSIKYDFDINAFFPLPEDLKNTTSPTNVVTEEEYKKWHEKKDAGKLTDWEIQCPPITSEMSNNLINKYGYDNWYDWCIKNWGTKWGAYDVYKSDDFSFVFLTAWDTPIPAMLVLSKLYPDVEIFVRYADEDFGCNTGEYRVKNGKIIEMYQPENSTEESIRLAISVDGSDRFYTDDLLDVDEDDDIEDTYTSTCIKLAHENGILDDFPKQILEKLLFYAIESEQYERASKIKKMIAEKTED